MAVTVFYSWQSDLPNKLNRGLIKKALEDAIHKINQELALEEAVRIDQDTEGITGSPPIVETILGKIEGCAVFVPDVSFVHSSENLRRSPNPNVMIEYGYALKACGDERIVPVFNTAFGDWERLPFDMRHKRRPILYDVPESSSVEERRAAREDLTRKFVSALRPFQTGRGIGVQENVSTHYQPMPAQDGMGGSFLKPDEQLGISERRRLSNSEANLNLRHGSKIYMRIWPKFPPNKYYSNTEVNMAINVSNLRPLCSGASGGWSYGRNKYGVFSYYAFPDAVKDAVGISQLFKSGEIWGIDTYYLNIQGRSETQNHPKYVPTGAVESELTLSLSSYLEAAKNHLELVPPLELRIGLTNTEGYEFAVPQELFMSGFAGRIFEEAFEFKGIIESYDISPEEILVPFFEELYDLAGLQRPENQR